MIANALPSTGMYHGTLAGKLTARISPVTSAELSKIVIGFFARRSNSNSKSTDDTTHSTVTVSAGKPK